MIVTNSNVVIIEKIGFLLVLFSQFCQVLLEQSRSRWLQKETNQTGNELLDIFQGEKGNKVDFPLQAFEVRAYICHQRLTLTLTFLAEWGWYSGQQRRGEAYALFEAKKIFLGSMVRWYGSSEMKKLIH